MFGYQNLSSRRRVPGFNKDFVRLMQRRCQGQEPLYHPEARQSVPVSTATDEDRKLAHLENQARDALNELRSGGDEMLAQLPTNDKLVKLGFDLVPLAYVLQTERLSAEVVVSMVERAASGQLSASIIREALNRLYNSEEARSLHREEAVLAALGFDVDVVNDCFARGLINGVSMRSLVHRVAVDGLEATGVNSALDYMRQTPDQRLAA